MINTICNLCVFNEEEKCAKESSNYTTEDGCYEFKDNEDFRD